MANEPLEKNVYLQQERGEQEQQIPEMASGRTATPQEARATT